MKKSSWADFWWQPIYLPSASDLGNYYFQKLTKATRQWIETHPVRSLAGILLAISTVGLTLGVPSPILGESGTTLEILTLSPPAVSLTTTATVRLPLSGVLQINQKFSSKHPGVDFDAEIGDPVYPIINGKVVGVQSWNHAYGKHLLVSHGQGLQSLYAHLNAINVWPGQMVTTETVLGLAGRTGYATGPHLYFELIDQGRQVNPLNLLEVK